MGGQVKFDLHDIDMGRVVEGLRLLARAYQVGEYDDIPREAQLRERDEVFDLLDYMQERWAHDVRVL